MFTLLYRPGLAKGLGGLQPGARHVGRPGFEDLLYFFFAGVENFAGGAIS
jgi:hypothetical protein